MIPVSRRRLSSGLTHEFYADKIPKGILKPDNSYQIYIIKINNPEDGLYEYSELILIETTHDRYYPVVLFNKNIADKYTAYMCDVKCDIEYIHKDMLIKLIPPTHLSRLEKVLEIL
jgi:hypothetical protein